jgi:hypothetical protein
VLRSHPNRSIAYRDGSGPSIRLQVGPEPAGALAHDCWRANAREPTNLTVLRIEQTGGRDGQPRPRSCARLILGEPFAAFRCQFFGLDLPLALTENRNVRHAKNTILPLPYLGFVFSGPCKAFSTPICPSGSTFPTLTRVALETNTLPACLPGRGYQTSEKGFRYCWL